MSGAGPESYVFTTLRYQKDLRHCDANKTLSDGTESATYLLAYHFERLEKAIESVFEKQEPNILERAGVKDTKQLLAVIEDLVHRQTNQEDSNAIQHAFRIRLSVDTEGRVTSSCMPVSQLNISLLFPQSFSSDTSFSFQWRVLIDSLPSTPSTATSHKTSDRSAYDRARLDAGITSFAETTEVLLYDDHGRVMDASITTPYFLRSGQWVTPSASFGGQQGVTRRWALENKLCFETEINIKSLYDGEMIWLSNAVKGFFPARVVTIRGA